MYRKFYAVFVLLLAIILPQAAFAVSPGVEAQGGDLLINGMLVCRFRVSEGGASPSTRARMAAMKLAEISGPEFTPETVEFAKVSDDLYRITARGVSIVMVQTADAAELSSTAEGLARVWANNLKTALVTQPIYMDAAAFVLPFQEQRSWQVRGTFTEDPEVTLDNDEVASVRYDPAGRALLAYGISCGSVNVTLRTGEFACSFVINVRKPAAVIPDSSVFEVTGNPCPSSLIKAGLKGAASGSVVLQEGAQLVVDGIDWKETSLSSGASSHATVKLTAKGSNYITVTRSVAVSIHNISEKREKPARIFYSNHPETMKKYQDLFTGTLENNVCTRLLYHHLNATGKTANLRIELINPGDAPVIVRSTRTAIKPMVDTISVGLQATKGFMSAEDKNISTYDIIPAHSTMYYLSDVMKNNDTSSGVMEFTQKSGDKGCIVRVSLKESGAGNPSVYSGTRYSGTGVFDEDDYIFGEPVKTITETYEVGGSWVFVSIGKEHLTTEKGTKLFGNYGVTYSMDFTITNPTDAERKIRIAFDPSAGAAAAYFTVNGEGVTIHHIKPPSEYNIYTTSLKPGETRRVKVETMPVSGSNYPAKVIVGTM